MRGLLAIVLLLAMGPGRAYAENKAIARDAYGEGTRLYDVGEFKAALEMFKKAYLNYEEPTFLFNMAQCYRQLDDKREALKMYKSYLRKQPAATNRDEVERIISSLEKALAEEQHALRAPPEGTIKPAPEPKRPTTSVDATTPAAQQLTASAPPRPAARAPLYKRWWVWTAVGVAAAAVAVGVGVGLTYRNSFDTTLAGFSHSGLTARF